MHFTYTSSLQRQSSFENYPLNSTIGLTYLWGDYISLKFEWILQPWLRTTHTCLNCSIEDIFLIDMEVEERSWVRMGPRIWETESRRLINLMKMCARTSEYVTFSSGTGHRPSQNACRRPYRGHEEPRLNVVQQRSTVVSVSKIRDFIQIQASEDDVPAHHALF